MDLPDDWATGTVRANGVDLQYYRTGSGPPLVLAHGFYDTGRCWKPLVDDLAADYDVVAYDARGHGRSDAPETGYGVDDRVADLVGVLDGLDVADPVVVGHSMGGSTAAWTAATHPDRVRALVLEDPAGMYGDPDMGPDERAQYARERVRDRADRSVEDIVASEYSDRDPDLARRIAVADRECDPNIAAIAREGYPLLADAFADIECPTLVLKADADTERRVRDLEAAAELATGRLVHVPGAGHCVFRDEYDAASAELRAFLAWLDERA